MGRKKKRDPLHPTLCLTELEEWIRKQVKELTREKVEEKTQTLVRMLNDSYFHRNPHKKPIPDYVRPIDQLSDSLAEQFFEAGTFAKEEMRSAFGDNYKKYIRPFWLFNDRNEGYKADLKRKKKLDQVKAIGIEYNTRIKIKEENHGYTKRYILKPEIVKMMDEFWKNDTPALIVDKNTENIITSADLPDNGICQSSYTQIKVPSIISFDLKRLNDFISQEEIQLNQSPVFFIIKHRRIRALRLLYVVRKWIVSFGGVPNLFRDYKEIATDRTGRLSGICEFNLQTLKKTARNVLYKEKDWYDYDLVSCHYMIAKSLAKAYELDTLILDEYLDHQKAYNRLFAWQLGINPKKMKKIMISFIYGQAIVANEKNAIYQDVQKDKSVIERLRNHAFITFLRCDLRNVMDEAVKRNTEGEYVINAIGKEAWIYNKKTCDEKREKRKRANKKLFSHILIGYEAWILNKICEDYCDVKVPMHDGFVCSNKRDIKVLEEMIRQKSLEELQIELRIKIKETTMKELEVIQEH